MTTPESILRITRDMASITPIEMEYVGDFHFDPVTSETVLGPVKSEHAKRLWVVAFKYGRQAKRMAYEIQSETDQARIDSLKADVRYLEELEILARQLCWMELKQEFGPVAWNAEAGAAPASNAPPPRFVREAATPAGTRSGCVHPRGHWNPCPACGWYFHSSGVWRRLFAQAGHIQSKYT